MAAVPETHLLVRKNIKSRQAPLAAPHQGNDLSLSVAFTPPLPLGPRSLLSPPRHARIHAHTNGEGKQQLEQHLDFTPVK